MKTIYPIEIIQSRDVENMYDLTGKGFKQFSRFARTKLVCRQSLIEGEIVYLKSPAIKQFCKILYLLEWEEGRKYLYEIEFLKDNLDIIEATAKQQGLI